MIMDGQFLPAIFPQVLADQPFSFAFRFEERKLSRKYMGKGARNSKKRGQR